MFFSQTGEYALRATVYLAANEKTPLTNQQIADFTCVPAGYLSKILQTLSKGGLVQSQRGIGGGFTLSRAANQITALDVVSSVDSINRYHKCPLNLEIHSEKLCPLHQTLDDALAMVEKALESATLVDLLDKQRAGKPFCDTNDLLETKTSA